MITPGMRFGRLQVVEQRGRAGDHVVWMCQCDCGETKLVQAGNLRHNTRSCGCLRRDLSRKALTKHGHAKGPTWSAWMRMRGRCEDPRNNRYDCYGGRGIAVCDRWKDFRNFLADMGERPSKDHSIDRIDNNRGYEPGNCRWATRKQQARNTSTNRLLEWAGMTLSLAEWCERADVSYGRVQARLDRGWPWPQALYLPKGSKI